MKYSVCANVLNCVLNILIQGSLIHDQQVILINRLFNSKNYVCVYDSIVWDLNLETQFLNTASW